MKKLIDTKTICLTGIFTALYCVLSAMMKFTIIGNIQVDLGYVVLAIACATIGPWAAVVGAVGCGLESIMFSAYGFSIGWFVGNLIIGLVCGYIFSQTQNIWIRFIMIVLATFLGIGVFKTYIECYLYHIPLEVKIIKNIVAFSVDTVCMICGTILYDRYKWRKMLTL